MSVPRSSCRRLCVAALLSLALFFSAAADARTVRQGASSTGEILGQVVWILKRCGYYDLATEMKNYAFQQFGADVNAGEASMGKFDGYSGNCGEIEDIALEYVEARRQQDFPGSNLGDEDSEAGPKP